jgi:hypothetical protein
VFPVWVGPNDFGLIHTTTSGTAESFIRKLLLNSH